MSIDIEDLREEIFTDYIQEYDHLSNDEISEMVDKELEIRKWLYSKSKAELKKLSDDPDYYGSRLQIAYEIWISKKAAKHLLMSIKADEALEEFFQRVMSYASTN